ncbi:hypothetical protein D3C71_1941930 [compost metagenome]
MRTAPRNTGQMPSMARASVVLPPPDGPISPSAWPAFNSRLTSLKSTAPVDGATVVTLSRDRLSCGAGRSRLPERSSSTPSVSFRR